MLDDTIIVHPINETQRNWPLGTDVETKGGPRWVGKIVGYFSTHFTLHGVVVESSAHSGAVQTFAVRDLEKI